MLWALAGLKTQLGESSDFESVSEVSRTTQVGFTNFAVVLGEEYQILRNVKPVRYRRDISPSSTFRWPACELTGFSSHVHGSVS